MPKASTAPLPPPGEDETKRLNLLKFAPFRLNRLATEFSNALADDYMARFGINIPEWRVMATLGLHDEPRSAQYVVRCTRTHKSRISRAVAHLAEIGFVERIENDDDRREVMLMLTPKGRTAYEELVPLLLAREETVLSALTEAERAGFELALDKLERAFGLLQCAE